MQPSVLAVKIPQGLSGIESENLSVEVLKGGRQLKQPRINKEAISERNSRWSVDISPARWSTGSYDLRFYSSKKLVYQFEAKFSHELITPLDY